MQVQRKRTDELSYVPRSTQYNGVVFRSRLEARWALVFDALEIQWLYEPVNFMLDAKWCPRLTCCGPEFAANRTYLPDFYLPQHKAWVEVKGDESNLRRGLMTWAASCLPANPNNSSTDEARLLLLGPVPYRDRTFTLLSSQPASYNMDPPSLGDVHAYRIRLDSPRVLAPWNYVRAIPDRKLAPLSNRVVVTHDPDDGRGTGPVLINDGFMEPWLDDVDTVQIASNDVDYHERRHWRSVREEFYADTDTVDVALQLARTWEKQGYLEDAAFIARRDSPPRFASATARADNWT